MEASCAADEVCSTVLDWARAFPPCNNAWHRGYYREPIDDPFHRYLHLEHDKESDLLLLAKDHEQYRCGIDGAHLMGVPFKCDLYHFHNILRRDSVVGLIKEAESLAAIWYANIDANNPRELNMTISHYNQISHSYHNVKFILSPNNPLPYLPWHNVDDEVGMEQGVVVLSLLLRPSYYASKLQVETLQKKVFGFVNAYGAAGHQLDGVEVDDAELQWSRLPLFARLLPLRLPWIKHFMRGLRFFRLARRGNRTRYLTLEMVNALDVIISQRWLDSMDKQESERLKELKELMCYIMIGICCGLQGGVVPLTAMNGLLHVWDET